MTNEPNKFLTQRSKLSTSPSYLKIKWLSLLFLVHYLLDFNKEAGFSLKFGHKPPPILWLSPCKRHFQFLLLSWRSDFWLFSFFTASLSKSLKKPPNRTISFVSILKKYSTSTFVFLVTNLHSFKGSILETKSHNSPICEDLHKKLTKVHKSSIKLMYTYMIWKTFVLLMIHGTETFSKYYKTQRNKDCTNK